MAIFYASKTLNDPQLHYSVIEKELLAVGFDRSDTSIEYWYLLQ